ncbi:sugar translocase [Pseudomonas putida]|uniref:Sugar translocase n=2 Tax=Pseudomonas putida TaxID=303 RepID=A0A2S3WYR9_PSEPU|nr:sugar translocase [Pseudomonas putida]POG09297.1 sugar translocase [Pseudomonas putida]
MAGQTSAPGLKSILADSWGLMLVGAIFSFFFASILMSGTPAGLIPDLSTPYSYAGDSLFHAWMAQRVEEGWVFDNARSGYPFGSSFLDFPGSDGGSHLAIKLLSMLGGSWVAGVNLFFLLGFPVCFVATFATSRVFGLNRSFAMAAGLLYTFLPFHFLRLQHLFYTWYFIAPVFFGLALSVYRTCPSLPAKGQASTRGKLAGMALGLIVLASFGVYYALFGVIVIAMAGVLSWIKTGRPRGMGKAAALCAAVVFGILINVAPNLLGNFTEGRNPEVAKRSFVESEIYGLKMMQLLLPRPEHRSSTLAKVGQAYNSSTPLINENNTSSMGLIGAAGFLLALLYVVFSPAGVLADERLRLVAATTLVLFLFATIGGLGSLFAMLVSPSIRGWNRISIFIAFGAILFLFLALELLLHRYAPRLSRYPAAVASAMLLVGLYDQTSPACLGCNQLQKNAFESDRAFVHAIEQALPQGAAIYQLPYIGFPETPPLHRLLNYQMMAGVLHSTSLHWSFGGMKGRPGDLFYRSLAQEPMAKQIEVARNLGFEGITIDRRGYADNAEALISELGSLLQEPATLQSSNGELVFFKLPGSKHPQLQGKSALEIMQQAGYQADALGTRYPATLDAGIDFTKGRWPDFIRNAKGVSNFEPWGLWSDKSRVKFEFNRKLPHRFTLVLEAQAYAANVGQSIRVEIGNQAYPIVLQSGVTQVRVHVDLGNTDADSITFIPPHPISPKEVSGSGDERRLAIGFVALRIVE